MESIASLTSADVTSITTLEDGSVPRTTVKVSVVFGSLTAVEPPVSATVKKALSMFVTVTLKLWSASPS